MVTRLPLVCNEGEMVERFQRKKDSFVNKNRNVSSKDYISLCYKQITRNSLLQRRESLISQFFC